MPPKVTPHRVIELFRSVVRKKYEIERVPHRFGTRHLLYNSEMHLIEMIGQYESMSVTQIAQTLGINKGAVSQTLQKLIEKGLVDKTPDPENASRVRLMLTPIGKKAFKAHLKWHRKADGGFRQYLENMTPDQMEFLFEFFSKFERFLDNRTKSAD